MKNPIKTTGLIERTPSKMVNFYEQMAITPEGMVQYRLLSNLKKTLWHKECDQVSQNSDLNYSTKRTDIVGVTYRQTGVT